MTSMKIGKYYNYSEKDLDNIIKITGIKYQPDGCMYGVSIKYKIYAEPIEGNVALLYTSRYYWDKYARELTKDDEAMVRIIREAYKSGFFDGVTLEEEE